MCDFKVPEGTVVGQDFLQQLPQTGNVPLPLTDFVHQTVQGLFRRHAEGQIKAPVRKSTNFGSAVPANIGSTGSAFFGKGLVVGPVPLWKSRSGFPRTVERMGNTGFVFQAFHRPSGAQATGTGRFCFLPSPEQL